MTACYKKYKTVEKLILFLIINQGILPEALYWTARPRRKY
jgi:hypothetical protein